MKTHYEKLLNYLLLDELINGENYRRNKYWRWTYAGYVYDCSGKNYALAA